MNDEPAPEIEASSGNVFADLGLPNPDLVLARAELAISLRELLDARGWSPQDAADAAGVEAEPLVAALRGDLLDVSLADLHRAVAASS